jgi:elongation factor G
VAVETETIRNVCLIGHRGSGKTSIAEGMVGLASGRSGPTSGVLDYTDEETERGMTLGMSGRGARSMCSTPPETGASSGTPL